MLSPLMGGEDLWPEQKGKLWICTNYGILIIYELYRIGSLKKGDTIIPYLSIIQPAQKNVNLCLPPPHTHTHTSREGFSHTSGNSGSFDFWDPPGEGGGYFLVMGHQMGSHFHDWTDYNGVPFWDIFNRVTRIGSHFFGTLRVRKGLILPKSDWYAVQN